MNMDRWQRIEEIFFAVTDRPLSEREDYLTRVCGDDEELRREVMSLLAQENADTFIQASIKSAAASFTSRPKEDMSDRRVGAFRITYLVGRGGMGAVYRAVRDDDEFDQQVAIKIIKRGVDTEFARDRFLRERQILAGLEHTNIARLLDGGTTEDGLPYFVMEFVAGDSITDYCRLHNLSLNARLNLFLQVCSAVRHAHQKLVVHRDIKPSNIFVTEDGTPKLLDFGIAKLLSHDPGEAWQQTETAMRMLTPDYASPEQVRGLAITTATDVYSLGVVLYEILTGCRPHQFKTRSLIEIERAICDTETEAPSKALKRTQGAPARLARRLAGDLDNIILMAMRKEPERRYQSVEQFSQDIRHYLEGRPVIARKDTLAYRAGKFARRHRLGLAATLFVALSLVSGIVATSWQARRAERRFEQVRKLANTFLFDFHDTIRNLPGSTEAREMVVKTALEYLDSLAREAAGDTELEWELAVAYQKVGDVQGDFWSENLGQTHDAMQSYLKSVSLAEKLAAENSDLKFQRLLADGYFKLGAHQSEVGDKIEAGETLRRAVSVAQNIARQSGDLDDLVVVQNCYIRLGDTELDTGDPTSALESYRQSLRLSERRAAEHPGDRSQAALAIDYSHVGEARAAMGDLTGAIINYRQSLHSVEELLRKHPDDRGYRRMLMIAYSWLGSLSGNPRSINLGDQHSALQYYRKALSIAEEAVSADPKNARALLDLASSHSNAGEILSRSDPHQSAEHFQKSLSIIRGLLKSSPDESSFLQREADYITGLADALRRINNRQGALQKLQQAHRVWRSLADKYPENTEVQASLHRALLDMADLLLDMEDRSGALEHYRQALALTESAMKNHSSDAYALWRLSDSYAGLGSYYAALGSDGRAAIDQRADNWRVARVWREKAFRVWDTWTERAGSSVFNISRREEAASRVAECDAALMKLN